MQATCSNGKENGSGIERGGNGEEGGKDIESKSNNKENKKTIEREINYALVPLCTGDVLHLKNSFLLT